MERKLFGVSGRGLKLEAGHRYRVVGIYDNPTGEMIKNGAMAEIVGSSPPSSMARWPAIDPDNPTFQKDIMSLKMRGQGHDMEGMDHGTMNH